MLNDVSIDDIMSFEQGEMEYDEMISFFQRLLDTGMVWKLQGSYARKAAHLLSAGLIHE